jgi:hypothetical protein
VAVEEVELAQVHVAVLLEQVAAARVELMAGKELLAQMASVVEAAEQVLVMEIVEVMELSSFAMC